MRCTSYTKLSAFIPLGNHRIFSALLVNLVSSVNINLYASMSIRLHVDPAQHWQRKHYGFIPDIIDILKQYGLMSYLLDYIEDGTFPSKQIWKSIVYNAVDSIQLNNWLNRVSSNDSFTRFRNIHTSMTITEFWKHSNSYHEIRNSFLITKLLTEIPNTTSNTCDICTRNFKDVYVHACCNCPKY